ncbi:RNA polymerase sigma factor [Thermodesulfobacteriota bacterium]
MSNIINTPLLDENELVSGLKKGQEEAYRILVRRYQARLFNIAYGITLDREESAEIVQEVFLKVYSGIHSFEGKSKLYTWLRRIAVNQSLNWHRRWKRRFRIRHQPLENEDTDTRMAPGTDEYGPESLYRKKELEKILNEELNRLPEEARSVFILKELEGLSYDEIAKLLKIKKGTVSSRIFYARQKLRKSLSKLLDQEENS